MRVAVAQLERAPCSHEDAFGLLAEAAERARACDLLVFSELALTDYGDRA
jgi:predicted amidohydrolase